jgi:hypothetical protein
MRNQAIKQLQDSLHESDAAGKCRKREKIIKN